MPPVPGYRQGMLKLKDALLTQMRMAPAKESTGLSPDIQRAVEIAKREMPDLAPVQPFGMVSRLLQPGAQAYASPGNTIYVNPTQLQGQSVEDVVDALTHEQAHVRQTRGRSANAWTEAIRRMWGSIGTPYQQREDELGAFQAEKDRRTRMGRGGTTAVPHFETGEFYAPYDVHLPKEKK